MGFTQPPRAGDGTPFEVTVRDPDGHPRGVKVHFGDGGAIHATLPTPSG